MGVGSEGSGGQRLPNFGRRAEVFNSPTFMPPETISTLQREMTGLYILLLIVLVSE